MARIRTALGNLKGIVGFMARGTQDERQEGAGLQARGVLDLRQLGILGLTKS